MLALQRTFQSHRVFPLGTLALTFRSIEVVASSLGYWRYLKMEKISTYRSTDAKVGKMWHPLEDHPPQHILQTKIK